MLSWCSVGGRSLSAWQWLLSYQLWIDSTELLSENSVRRETPIEFRILGEILSSRA